MDSRHSKRWKVLTKVEQDLAKEKELNVRIIHAENAEKCEIMKASDQTTVIISWAGNSKRITKVFKDNLNEKVLDSIEHAIALVEELFMDNPLPQEKKESACLIYVAGYSQLNKTYLVHIVGDIINSKTYVRSELKSGNFPNFGAMEGGARFAISELKKQSVKFHMDKEIATDCIMKSMTEACKNSHTCGGMLTVYSLTNEARHIVKYQLYPLKAIVEKEVPFNQNTVLFLSRFPEEMNYYVLRKCLKRYKVLKDPICLGKLQEDSKCHLYFVVFMTM